MGHLEWHTVGKAVFQLTDVLLRDCMSTPVFQTHVPRAVGCAVVTLAMQSLDVLLPQPKEEVRAFHVITQQFINENNVVVPVMGRYVDESLRQDSQRAGGRHPEAMPGRAG